MTETYTARGHWWLPGHEDKKVAGELSFDPDTGGSLTLIGALRLWTDDAEQVVSEGGAITLHRVQKLEDRAGTYPRIFGEAGGRPLTLDDCFQVYVSGTGFRGNNATQVIRVARVLKGKHFAENEPVEASGVSVALAYLDDWVMETYIGESMNFLGETNSQLQKIDLVVEKKPNRSVGLADGSTLSLDYQMGVTGRRSTLRSLWQGYRLRIDREDVVPLDDLLDQVSDVQDLVSIATGRDAAFQNITADHPDLQRRFSETRTFQSPYEVIARWQIQDRAKKPDEIEHHELLFTFSDFDGMNGLAKWMETAAKYRTVLGRVMSTRATPDMFVSDQMLNYTAALEGFDRTRTGEEKDKLPARLKRCATQAGPFFATMVGNVNKWAEAVAYHRNDIAHHFGRRPRGSYAEQHYLGQSVYWAFVFSMLREAGAPEAVFDRIAEHNLFVFLNPEVLAVLNAYAPGGRTRTT